MILLDAWDRIVFFRERQFSERLKLVTEALPVLVEIDEMERRNRMPREQAQILRQNITTGVSLFLETGGRIPSMEERTHFEPAKLLQASETLLLPPPGDSNRDRDSQQQPPRVPSRRPSRTPPSVSSSSGTAARSNRGTGRGARTGRSKR
jgi:hypothetical protein